VIAGSRTKDRAEDSHRCTPVVAGARLVLCVKMYCQGPSEGTRGRAMKFDTAYLEEFIRTKIELETLTDAQIARLLNVGTSTVSHWRNKFHIKPADKFKRKFEEKYGPDALRSFDILVQHNATLQEIGRYFGFSREYARQVYNKLYQGSSRAQQRQRAQARRRDVLNDIPSQRTRG